MSLKLTTLQLRDNITHLIHSAWQLNFNMVLESFEKTHVAGVRHLIDLVLSSPRPTCPRFVFLSSISSVSEYHEGGEVPEVSFSDPSITKMGYGLSKFVGERIIDNAVEKAGLNGTVIRIGQISYVTSRTIYQHVLILALAEARLVRRPGHALNNIQLCSPQAWRWGWYPTISQYVSCSSSSFTLLTIPQPVRWIPADITARVILSQSFHPAAKPLDYFHLENPDVTPWSSVAEVLSTHNGRSLKQVPMEEWLAEVKRRSQEPGFDADKLPAFRLLGFWENEVTMPVLGVSTLR